MILGRATCEALSMIKRIHEVSVNDDILKQYEDLFTGPGCMPGYHLIQVDLSVKPVVHAPQKVPVALKERIIEEKNCTGWRTRMSLRDKQNQLIG